MSEHITQPEPRPPYDALAVEFDALLEAFEDAANDFGLIKNLFEQGQASSAEYNAALNRETAARNALATAIAALRKRLRELAEALWDIQALPQFGIGWIDMNQVMWIINNARAAEPREGNDA